MILKGATACKRLRLKFSQGRADSYANKWCINYHNSWMAADTAKLITSLVLSLSNLSFDTLSCRINIMWVMKGWQKHILKCWSRSNWWSNGENFWNLADTMKLIISSDLPGKTFGVGPSWCPIHYFYMM